MYDAAPQRRFQIPNLNMDSIKDILPQVIEQLSLRQPQTQNKIQRIWENLTDERTAAHCALSDFSGGQLTILVDSSPWLYQMNLKKKKILEQLQEEIAEIKMIHFKIGKVQWKKKNKILK